MRPLGLLALCALAACCAPHHEYVHHGSVHHRFDDPAQWAPMFEDPSRDAWQKPDQVIAALEIPHGGKVADIGAATGYFSVRIAHARSDVTVYGVDIEPEMVRYLDQRARKEQLPNLQALLGAPTDPKLPQRVDVALVVDTYHHLEDRPAYFAHLADTELTPGAKVAIVDFKRGVPRGPPDEHKLAPAQVIEEMKQAGFCVHAQPDFLPDQYLLIFQRCG